MPLLQSYTLTLPTLLLAPLENLRHLKRVHKKFVQGGETQLSVILFLASQNGNQLDSIQIDVRELMNSYKLSPFITKVCKYATSSKEEWEEQRKLWPTSYHPPTYNIQGITGFSEEDSHSVFSFMKYAVQLANSGDNSETKNSLLAYLETSCSGKRETSVCHSSTNGVVSREEHSNGFPDKSEQLYSDVSCLNPLEMGSARIGHEFALLPPFASHCIVAIESCAARDRILFPSLGKTQDKSFEIDRMQSSSAGSPAKRVVLHNVNGDDNLDVDSEGCSRSLSARPCLCTGFDTYLVWEPCILCEMALVRRRIGRIFFAYRNAKAGALGSVHRLQNQRSLNHHYAVFRVLLGTDS